MPSFKNWKTIVTALIPLAAYGLNYFGLWPTSIPLPPFDQIWPVLLGLAGVGVQAKDNNVTGGTIQQ